MKKIEDMTNVELLETFEEEVRWQHYDPLCDHNSSYDYDLDALEREIFVRMKEGTGEG